MLTVALVLGEYTMATLDLYQTFPVWIVVNDQVSAQVSVAASLLALFVTWLVLMLITLLGTRQSRRRGGGEVTLFTATATTDDRKLMATNETPPTRPRPTAATAAGMPAPATAAAAGPACRCAA